VAAGSVIEITTPRLRLVGHGRGGWGDWLMHAGENVVGDLGFRGPPDDEGSVEIGYRVRDQYRRRGYATEAAAALVGWALADARVTRVVATCDRANIASIGVLERIGARRVVERYGVVRWEVARGVRTPFART
jgi:ribosomal-protein-alanine N-acetyltransferase